MNSIVHFKDKSLLNGSSLKVSLVVDNNLCCKRDFADVFDTPCFLEQLRKEKSRAQRSGSQLSLLILAKNNLAHLKPGELNGMLKTVKTKIRDIDAAGYIDQQTIGVILPYTDKEGAEKFAKKLLDNNINQPFSIATATYPDQVFASLEKNGCVAPHVLEYMFDDAISAPHQGLYFKRMIDIIGALTGLVLFSPLMLTVALLVKMSSPGPVIFRQTRLGKKGAPFTFYKFRSMRTDTNDQIHRDYVKELICGNHVNINNSTTETPLYKMKSDPRITRVGKFIRKTSIDELPQFFNVLKGDMSLVGPRPPLAYEAEKYQSWHLRRILDIKPGITGLWQVEGRSRTGFNDAVRLDLQYLKQQSNALDIKILFKTVKEVVQCRGAV